jgi:hypothetical protein
VVVVHDVATVRDHWGTSALDRSKKIAEDGRITMAAVAQTECRASAPRITSHVDATRKAGYCDDITAR